MWIVQKPRVGGGASQPDDLMIMIHQLVCIYIYIYMVGGIPTPLKNMKVSWDDEIPNIIEK